MGKSRFSEEQIFGLLEEAEAGRKIGDRCREQGISEKTLYRWRSKYSGSEVKDAKRLRQLEDENRLKQRVSDQRLDNQALKAALRVVKPQGRRRLVRLFQEALGLSSSKGLQPGGDPPVRRGVRLPPVEPDEHPAVRRR